MPIHSPAERGIRAAQLGIVVNATLAAVKLVAGILGNTYALVADAVESAADIFGSLVVWGGLQISSQPADSDHPYGHGKAEPLAGAVVAIMLIGAGIGIAVAAIPGIRTPHGTPAPWTLAVLVGVILVKWAMSRRVRAVGVQIDSTAVRVDAYHHLSDAITSGAAFVGISIALVGERVWGGTGWASADDWAALLTAVVVVFNGVNFLIAAMHELMDRAPGPELLDAVRRVAQGVPGVLAVEKLSARKTGLVHRVVIHVQADPGMTLETAHELGHRVERAITSADHRVASVLVHMEPFRE
jgi:cation diffusion facilitator family transporter